MTLVDISNVIILDFLRRAFLKPHELAKLAYYTAMLLLCLCYLSGLYAPMYEL